jgi:peptidoglycan/LPS O-acetylase OafA/YrhL
MWLEHFIIASDPRDSRSLFASSATMLDRASRVDASSLVDDKRIFHTLDALRGIAAVAVVTLHYKDFFRPFAATHAYLAVDFFFVMSGVVIENAYAASFARGMSAVEFTKVRLIRLYPLYLVAIAIASISAIGSYFGNNKSGFVDLHSLATSAVLSLFFVPSPSAATGGYIFPLNPAVWSLLFELAVNILYALLWSRFRKARTLLATIAATGAIVALAALYFGGIDFGPGGTMADVVIGFSRATFGFLCGVALFRLSEDYLAAPESPPAALDLFGLLSVIGALAPLLFRKAPGAWNGALDATAILLVFPAIVWCAMRINLRGPLRWLASILGESSYAVYVLHLPALSVAAAISARCGNPLVAGAPYSGFVVILVLIAACWLLEILYDAPARRWLRERLAPRRDSTRG